MAHAQQERSEKRRAFLLTGRRDLPLLERRDADRRAGRRRARRPGLRSASTRSSRRSSSRCSCRRSARRRAVGAALLGAAIALALLPFAPAGVPVMAAVLGCAARSCAAGARMSWWAVLALCACAYALKARRRRRWPPAPRREAAAPRLARDRRRARDRGARRRPDARRRRARSCSTPRLPALLVAAVLIWRTRADHRDRARGGRHRRAAAAPRLGPPRTRCDVGGLPCGATHVDACFSAGARKATGTSEPGDPMTASAPPDAAPGSRPLTPERPPAGGWRFRDVDRADLRRNREVEPDGPQGPRRALA